MPDTEQATQRTLDFEKKIEYGTPFEKDGGVIPFDPHVAPREKKIRLSRQCKEILDRLRQGPATQRELMMIASQYNARIFALRGEGYNIPSPEQNHKTGISIYHIEEEG